MPLLECALAGMGFTSLLLSTNNSVEAVVHLLKQTEAVGLIYSEKFEGVAKAAGKLLGQSFTLNEEKRFPLWGKDGVDSSAEKGDMNDETLLTPEEEKARTCVILHSSGSVSRLFRFFPHDLYMI